MSIRTLRLALVGLILSAIGAVPAQADLSSLVMTLVKTSAGKRGVTQVKEEKFDFSKVIGKQPVMILYWSPAVPASVDELKRYDAFAARQKKGRILYLSAARTVDEQEGFDVRRVAEQSSLKVGVLLDSQLNLGRQITAQFLPAYYGVNGKGDVKISGFGSLADLTSQGGNLESALLHAGGDLPFLTPPPPRELHLGDTAPDFTLPALAGGNLQLRSQIGSGGRNTMILFWSVYCPHCQRELPRIQRYMNNRGGAPFNVVSVTRIAGAEDRQATEMFVEKERIQFPVLIDGGQVIDKYQVKGIPFWMMVDPAGRILTLQSGEKEGLEGLLAKYAK